MVGLALMSAMASRGSLKMKKSYDLFQRCIEMSISHRYMTFVLMTCLKNAEKAGADLADMSDF